MRIRYYVISTRSMTEEEALAEYSAQIAMLDAADSQLHKAHGSACTHILNVGRRWEYVNGSIAYYLEPTKVRTT